MSSASITRPLQMQRCFPPQHPACALAAPSNKTTSTAFARSIQAAPILGAAKRAQAVLSPPIVRADSLVFSPPLKAPSVSASRIAPTQGPFAPQAKNAPHSPQELPCVLAKATPIATTAKPAKTTNVREVPLREETANSAKSAMPKTSVQRD